MSFLQGVRTLADKSAPPDLAPNYTSTDMRSMSPPSISRRSLLIGATSLGLTLPYSRAGHAQEPAFPLVVDLDWLSKASNQPGLRVLDVSPLHTWRDGHIDAARHAWWRDTVDPNYPVFGAVLTPNDDQLHRQRVIDSLNLGEWGLVVVYDNNKGFSAARLVWFLRFLGFDQAALLNAGFAEWKQNPFSIESPTESGGSPIVRPRVGYYLVTEEVLARLPEPDAQIVDIRTDDERADDLDGTMPTGQIPGSVRLPWTAFLDENGHLHAASEIDALAASAKLAKDQPTILYGRFGVDTALAWLALRRSGFTDVQSYDRGWAEWSITPGLPREPLS